VVDLKTEYELAYLSPLMNKTFELTRASRYDEALALCNEAIDANPADPDAYNARYFVYTCLERMDQALNDIRRAVSLAPGNLSYVYMRMKLLIEENDFFGAISDATALVQEGSPEAFVNDGYLARAYCHAMLGKTELAEADILKVPDDGEIRIGDRFWTPETVRAIYA
jgi:tetratricopeptide (TPR) repeat protein